MPARMMPYSLKHPKIPHHVSLGPFTCRYRSKVCMNPRAHKRDGSIHRYCQQHRERANSTQKKWAKRRMQAADESELILSYQWSLQTHGLGLPNTTVDSINKESTPLLPPISDGLDMSKDLDGFPVIESDLTDDLLWESLGFDYVKLETDIKL